MKKRILYIILLFVAFAATPAMSQNVSFEAYFDSVHIDTKEIRIGEQVKLSLELSVDPGNKVEILVPDSIINNVEVLGYNDYITIDANGKEKYRRECTITSFLDGTWEIPQFNAKVNDVPQPYYTRPTYLVVNSVPIDTANLKNIKGLNPIWEVELGWEDYRDTVYLSYMVVVYALLLIWVVIRFIKNKPIIRIVRVKPKKPSHFTALQKMDEIKRDRTLHSDESVKDYYTRLTDTLREYMQNRYNFNAVDMTTSEIIDNLLRFNDKDAICEVKELLEVADLVKFAKMQPTQYENDSNLRNAVDFVNATKNIEEENLKPVETKVVNERSMAQKRWLIAAIIVVAGILVAVVSLLVTDLGHLLG